MRPLSLVIVALCGLVAATVWWWSSRAVPPPTVPPKTPDLPRPVEALRKLVDPAASVPAMALKKPLTQAPETAEAPCELEGQALAETDLSLFLKNGDPTTPFVEITDREAFRKALERVGKAGAGCSPTSEKGGTSSPRERWRQVCDFSKDLALAAKGLSRETREQLCAVELFTYRATVIDQRFAKVPVGQLNDPILVSNRLLASLSNGTADPAVVAELADRLVEISPDNGDAARHSLDAHFQRASLGASDLTGLEKAVDRLERLDPGGELATEGKMALLRLKGDGGAMSRLAEEYEAKHPESSLGPYYRAWGSYLSGDREKAIQLLQSIKGAGVTEQYAAHARQQIEYRAKAQQEGHSGIDEKASPFSPVNFGGPGRTEAP